jgi:PAS domain S-box-containing protein
MGEAQIAQLLPAQASVSRWRLSRRRMVALVVVLFAAIFALRMVDDNAANGILLLFVLPIVLCSLEFGVLGGVAAGASAVVLVIAWDLFEHAGAGPLGYAARGAAFLALGVTLGRFVSRRHALEGKIRRYFDSSLDLLATADFNGYFKELNPAWEKTLGYKRAELMAKPFVEFVHPDDRARTLAEAEKLTQPGAETVSFRNRYRASDGSYRWLEWSSRSIPEERLIYAIARDTTAQMEAEATARDAKEAAERANRAKSEFLSRMSHELRTPLNAVLGFGQLLETDDLSSGQRESVRQILKGGRHLLELINEVLDISRIEAGNMTMSLEPVHVGGTLGEVIDLVRPLADERGVSLVRPSSEASGEYVSADTQRLKQVLLNLLSNAIKYNRDGGSVTVSLEPVGTPGCPTHLLILVTDTGQGISEEQQARLFSPFDRLGAERSSIEGTGLGLTLSRLLVEEMGGTLTVESQPWVGSTFLVKLALVAGPLDSAEPVDSGPHGASGHDPPGASRKILYVEDNLANFELVERVLESRPDLELLTTMNGNLAFELAQQHRPDLVLLDLHLPGMSGEDVLRRLKRDPATRDIPVVVVSADATERRIKDLLAAGAVEYLTKPLDIHRFVAVVDETLAEPVGA